jgi:hypothetical protein
VEPPQTCGTHGFGSNIEANVVGFVRYRIVEDNRAGAPFGKLDLIREDMEYVNGSLTPVTGSQLVIVEYAVDLQIYDMAFDDDATGLNPQITTITKNVNEVLDSLGDGVDARPEDLRFITVALTVRSDTEDESFQHKARENPYDPILSYELFPELEGACRVATLASKLETRSLSVRNLK